MMNGLRKVPFNCLCNNISSITSNFGKRLRVPVANLQNSVRWLAHSYEGDGKTSATILNMEEQVGLMINSYSPHGFRLNNNLFVRGSLVLFPNTALSWHVHNIDDITMESLAIFPILDPPIDLVIIGGGDMELISRKKRNRLIGLMKYFKIPVEVLPTDIACTTYNFLVAENRFVGAALIPQSKGYAFGKDEIGKMVDEHGILS